MTGANIGRFGTYPNFLWLTVSSVTGLVTLYWQRFTAKNKKKESVSLVQ